MDKEQADCTALIRCTAEALDDEMLEILLVSAQQVNLEICVNHAVRRKVKDDFSALSSSDKFYFRALKLVLVFPSLLYALEQQRDWTIQSKMAVWFPHVHVGLED